MHKMEMPRSDKSIKIICGSDSKESACNAGDLGSISGSGRPPREGNGQPLQDSCLVNSTDKIIHVW